VPTVLVVDDEPMIRKFVRFVLEREGFQVLIAENGADAIQVSKHHMGKIDLLLSDVTMPGMDGPTLATELVAADPQLPVLLMSGACQGSTDMRFGFLSKPFSVAKLMLTVRGMACCNPAAPAALKRSG